MQRSSFVSLMSSTAFAALLTACGGGSIGPDELEQTARTGTVVVTNASAPALNGTYTTTNMQLTQVLKADPFGADPEVCKFEFAGPTGPGGMMDGDIRYRPGTSQIWKVSISIQGIDFESFAVENVAVDRTNHEIDFTAKVFNPGTAASITLTGSIPMRIDRPEGC